MKRAEGGNGKEGLPRILVVDDLEENVKLLCNFLRPKGFDTEAALSGAEALDRVRESPPDVVLLDLMMPGLDGFEVCRMLKQDTATQHIPVIIVTGMSDKEANVKALEVGADDFLLKPFDAVLLDARIRSSLRTKMLQDRIISYHQKLEKANEELEERVRERSALAERTQQVAVFSLAKLAESRDTETGQHLERMRCYAREIARELREQRYSPEVTADFVESIYQSSPLHDIGKVGIPDRILLKPGKLTTKEFEIMKGHTLIGGDTLRVAGIEAGQDSFLAMGRDIAYYHHERWDGTGYPHSLAGTDIPLAARVVALADVYDALSSKRPYKEPFSHVKSRSIILEGRGSHFDPAIVDAFLAREKTFIEIRDSHRDDMERPLIVRLMEALEEQDKG